MTIILVAILIIALIIVLGAGIPQILSGTLKDAPFIPTNRKSMEKLLSLAELSEEDFVIELGSGDGRILRNAAKKYGISGFGIEWVWWLIPISNYLAKKEGVDKKIKFKRGDFWKEDLSEASVLLVYLMPTALRKLSEKFKRELKPGSKILSHAFKIPGLKLVKKLEKDKQGSACFMYEV